MPWNEYCLQNSISNRIFECVNSNFSEYALIADDFSRAKSSVSLIFQATLTSSEDGSTGSLIPSAWTLWKATLATSAWIFSAVKMSECLWRIGITDFDFFVVFFLSCFFGDEEEFFRNRAFCMFILWIGGVWGPTMKRPLQSNLFMLYSLYWYSDQLHRLLRKTKLCFLRLGTSCAAILIFILHILSS